MYPILSRALAPAHFSWSLQHLRHRGLRDVSSGLVHTQFSGVMEGARHRGLRRLSSAPIWHGTTILAVRKDEAVCVIGDGQVTMGSYVVKNNARKVRRLGPNNRVVAGFAGATADALTLFERLESKLDEHPEQLLRACVSLAKDWRMDKYLRRLDAMLLVCDRDISLYLTGTGDVLEPPDGVIGIGSGGSYAIAAARALMPVPGMTAEMIARSAMTIAADLCVYTNSNVVVENILPPSDDPPSAEELRGPSLPSSPDPPSSPE